MVATPATEAENTAPTPTPSTPGNNQHNVNGKTANGPNQNASLQAPTSIAAPQTNNIPPPQPEPQFGGMDAEVNVSLTPDQSSVTPSFQSRFLRFAEWFR